MYCLTDLNMSGVFPRNFMKKGVKKVLEGSYVETYNANYDELVVKLEKRTVVMGNIFDWFKANFLRYLVINNLKRRD